MKIIELAPVKESTADFDELEKRIKQLFKTEIYFPLIEQLESSQIINSIDELARAIFIGRVRFYHGQFTGKFSAAISRTLYKIGARRDLKQGSFRIPLSKLPPAIKSAISQAESRFDQTIEKLDRTLSQILPEKVAEKLKAEDLFDKTLWKVDKELRGTLKSIVVQPELKKEQREKIAKDWSNNMEKYIVDWTEKEIKTLRQKMQEHVFAGKRYEDIVSTIEKSYGVSKSKAKFLARQETGLLMAKFKESRYADAGIDEYKWFSVVGSTNHPVRPEHKALADQSKKGKIFKFSKPPVTSPDGRRNNPGEDFNCRCFARPIVRFK